MRLLAQAMHDLVNGLIRLNNHPRPVQQVRPPPPPPSSALLCWLGSSIKNRPGGSAFRISSEDLPGYHFLFRLFRSVERRLPGVVTEDLISGVAGNGEAHIVLCALFGRGARVGGFGTC